MSAASLGPWGPVSPSDLSRSPDRSYQAQLAAPLPGTSVLPGISLVDLREVPAELRHTQVAAVSVGEEAWRQGP